MNRIWFVFIIIVLALLFCGCSGSGTNPLIPSDSGDELLLTGDAEIQKSGDDGHQLWGLWGVMLDTQSSELELIPLRGASFHMNVSRILNDVMMGLSFEINSFDPVEGIADIDVTLTHPVPDSDFRGFDVRGIFMGPGETIVSKTDPNLIYNGLNAARLLNADGYTRWWNAVEFTSPGMFGYYEDNVVPGFLIPATTLNPYKYFADALWSEDPVVPKVNISNRGTFSTDINPPSLTRNYLIKFPYIGGDLKVVFHYAVDASWVEPTGDSSSPKPIGDFPINANCQEAFHIEVDSGGSTAWYQGADANGGDLVFDITVHDWQASENPMGILGEIDAIWLESDTLFDTFYVDPSSVLMNSQTTCGTFHVIIPDVHPTGIENQEVLVTVRSKEPTSYAPPFGMTDYPESAVLAAYTIVDVAISSVPPASTTLNLESPNGGEVWIANEPAEITWNSFDVSMVSILLSTDSGATYPIPVAVNIPNTDSFEIDFVLPALVGDNNRIKVFDVANPDIYDESDGDFMILENTDEPLTVVSPNGGEFILANSNFEIKWQCDDNIENVGIVFSENSGENFSKPITMSTPAQDGSYMWNYVPAELVGSTSRIRIFNTDNVAVYDISDGDFAILPETEPLISVITPNGEETWYAETTREIKWFANQSITDVKIEFSADGGENYLAEHLITPQTINDGSFMWESIPDWAVGVMNRIRISDVESPLVSDQSNADFTVLEAGLDDEIHILNPEGGDQWTLGFDHVIEWQWIGDIAMVDILIDLDQDGSWEILAQDVANVGSYMVQNFIPAGSGNHASWNSIERNALIKIESTTGSASDETDVTIPINLGLLYDKISASVDADDDMDSIPNDIEAFLGTYLIDEFGDYILDEYSCLQEDRDCDHDGYYDFNEIFGQGYFDNFALIPNEDGDDLIAPIDPDDNNDGTNDGELLDSDLDGIPNYLEYYGYTYNWLTDTYSIWNGYDITQQYFKTDPLQWSTDQDPYSDSMETSKLMMDPSVQYPGDLPMVPGFPEIVVYLEQYSITPIAEITSEEGGSVSSEDHWDASTERSQDYSKTHESEFHWDQSTEITAEYSFPGGSVGTTVSYGIGGSTSDSSTAGWSCGTSESQGGSTALENNWNTATTTNPAEAAKITLNLKVYNYGTTCATNIMPTLTLKIGSSCVATFKPDMCINVLEPNSCYPMGGGVYWVVEKDENGDDITLTLEELQALETGAPVSVFLTQMDADVMRLSDGGSWETVGEWDQYMPSIHAVTADIFMDMGIGDMLHTLVYADNNPSSPLVTLEDALVWAANGRKATAADSEFPLGTPLIDYYDPSGGLHTESLDGWRFCFDPDTFDSVIETVSAGGLLLQTPLNPDSRIIARAPDPDNDASIHFAYISESKNYIACCATAYDGVESVYWIDKFGVEAEIPELSPGSGIYIDNVASNYVSDGSEQICVVPRVRLTDDNPPGTYCEQLQTIPAPVPPELIEPAVTSAVQDKNLHKLFAVIEPNGLEVTEVRLDVMCDDDTVTYYLTNDYGNNWSCDLPMDYEYEDVNCIKSLHAKNIHNEVMVPVFDLIDTWWEADHVKLYSPVTEDGRVRQPYHYTSIDFDTGRIEYQPLIDSEMRYDVKIVHYDLGDQILFSWYGWDENDAVGLKWPDSGMAFGELTRADLETYHPWMWDSNTWQDYSFEDSAGSTFIMWTGAHYARLKVNSITHHDEADMNFYEFDCDFVVFRNEDETGYPEGWTYPEGTVNLSGHETLYAKYDWPFITDTYIDFDTGTITEFGGGIMWPDGYDMKLVKTSSYYDFRCYLTGWASGPYSPNVVYEDLVRPIDFEYLYFDYSMYLYQDGYETIIMITDNDPPSLVKCISTSGTYTATECWVEIDYTTYLSD